MIICRKIPRQNLATPPSKNPKLDAEIHEDGIGAKVKVAGGKVPNNPAPSSKPNGEAIPPGNVKRGRKRKISNEADSAMTSCNAPSGSSKDSSTDSATVVGYVVSTYFTSHE